MTYAPGQEVPASAVTPSIVRLGWVTRVVVADVGELPGGNGGHPSATDFPPAPVRRKAGSPSTSRTTVRAGRS